MSVKGFFMGYTMSATELNELRNDVNDIKVELEPIKQAIPMLVELSKQSVEILQQQATQTEMIKYVTQCSSKNERKIELQNEKIGKLQVSSAVNAGKIATVVSVVMAIIGIAISKLFS